jgi:hypothetical protein
MHIDTHVLELEYFNYDNVNPFKNSFFLCKFEALRTCFSIWTTTTCCDMVKDDLKFLWGSQNDRNGFQKWKVMILLYVYFAQNGTNNTKSRKVTEIILKKIKCNIININFQKMCSTL